MQMIQETLVLLVEIILEVTAEILGITVGKTYPAITI